MELSKKRVLVFGTGISGIGASHLLRKQQANVILYDGNEAIHTTDIQKKLGSDQEVEIVLGELKDEVIHTLDLVILSPGIPVDLPIINRIRESNIPIWGEVELAFQSGRGEVLAITGTNGKTTTTALLGEIMKKWKSSVFIVGNIGNPYTEAVLQMTEDSVTVAEISSFQLETIDTFRPKVSAILNITEDHLNRHHTMEAYIEAKFAVTRNQTSDDICVLNYEDEILRQGAKKIAPRVLYFSSQRKLEKGIYLDQNHIIYKEKESIPICKVGELRLLGIHNYENIMAAVAMAIAYGTPIGVIRDVIKNFSGVEHRIEYVCEKHGITYYNDSKGTNPAAAIKGIQAMNRPTLLIGGGYDKDSNYDEWIHAFQGKVKYLVLIGETKQKIAATAEQCGFFNSIMADTLEEAIDICTKLAVSGDAVLLSPACASWGMFENFEQRGDKFKEIVNRL